MYDSLYSRSNNNEPLALTKIRRDIVELNKILADRQPKTSRWPITNITHSTSFYDSTTDSTRQYGKRLFASPIRKSTTHNNSTINLHRPNNNSSTQSHHIPRGRSEYNQDELQDKIKVLSAELHNVRTQLDSTTQKLHEQTQSIVSMQLQRDQLRQQYEQADVGMKQLQHDNQQSQLNYHDTINTLQNELKSKSVQLEELEHEYGIELDELQSSINTLTTSHQQQLHQQTTESQLQLGVVRNEHDKIVDNMRSNHEHQIQVLHNEINELHIEHDSLLERNHKLMQSVSELSTRSIEQQSTIDTLNGKLDVITTQHDQTKQSLIDQFNQAQSEWHTLQQQYIEQVSTLRQTNQQDIKHIDSIWQQKYIILHNDNKQHQNHITQLNQQVQKLSSGNDELHASLSCAESRISNDTVSIDELNGRIVELDRLNVCHVNDINTLQHQHHTMLHDNQLHIAELTNTLDTVNHQLQHNIIQHTQQCTELQDQLTQLTAQYQADIHIMTQQHITELHHVQPLIVLQVSVSADDGSASAVSSEIELLRDTQQKYIDSIVELQGELSELKCENEQHQQHIHQLTHDITNCNKQINEAQVDNVLLHARINEMSSESRPSDFVVVDDNAMLIDNVFELEVVVQHQSQTIQLLQQQNELADITEDQLHQQLITQQTQFTKQLQQLKRTIHKLQRQADYHHLSCPSQSINTNSQDVLYHTNVGVSVSDQLLLVSQLAVEHQLDDINRLRSQYNHILQQHSTAMSTNTDLQSVNHKLSQNINGMTIQIQTLQQQLSHAHHSNNSSSISNSSPHPDNTHTIHTDSEMRISELAVELQSVQQQLSDEKQASAMIELNVQQITRTYVQLQSEHSILQQQNDASIQRYNELVNNNNLIVQQLRSAQLAVQSLHNDHTSAMTVNRALRENLCMSERMLHENVSHSKQQLYILRQQLYNTNYALEQQAQLIHRYISRNQQLRDHNYLIGGLTKVKLLSQINNNANAAHSSPPTATTTSKSTHALPQSSHINNTTHMLGSPIPLSHTFHLQPTVAQAMQSFEFTSHQTLDLNYTSEQLSFDNTDSEKQSTYVLQSIAQPDIAVVMRVIPTINQSEWPSVVLAIQPLLDINDSSIAVEPSDYIVSQTQQPTIMLSNTQHEHDAYDLSSDHSLELSTPTHDQSDNEQFHHVITHSRPRANQSFSLELTGNVGNHTISDTNHHTINSTLDTALIWSDRIKQLQADIEAQQLLHTEQQAELQQHIQQLQKQIADNGPLLNASLLMDYCNREMLPVLTQCWHNVRATSHTQIQRIDRLHSRINNLHLLLKDKYNSSVHVKPTQPIDDTALSPSSDLTRSLSKFRAELAAQPQSNTQLNQQLLQHSSNYYDESNRSIDHSKSQSSGCVNDSTRNDVNEMQQALVDSGINVRQLIQQLNSLQLECDGHVATNQSIRKTCDALQVELNRLQFEHTELRNSYDNRLQQRDDQWSDINNRLKQGIQQVKLMMSHQLDDARQEITTLRSQLQLIEISSIPAKRSRCRSTSDQPNKLKRSTSSTAIGRADSKSTRSSMTAQLQDGDTLLQSIQLKHSSEVSTLQSQLTQHKQHAQNLQDKLCSWNVDIVKVQQVNSKLTQQLNYVDKQYGVLKRENQRLNDVVQDLQLLADNHTASMDTIKQLNSQISMKNSQITQLQSMIESNQADQHTDIAIQLNQADSTIVQLKSELKLTQHQLDKLTLEKNQIQQQLQVMQSELTESNTRYTKLLKMKQFVNNNSSSLTSPSIHTHTIG